MKKKTTASTTSFKTNNPIIEYTEQIVQNKIIVCEKIKKIYTKLSNELESVGSRWIYDGKKANHAIEFVEKYCRHSQGDWKGKPLRLELYQKARWAATYGFVDADTEYRRFTEVLYMVARKNGKSCESSADGLYMVIGDGEGGAEVYCVANKQDQAKIIWLESRRMLNKSPALRKRLKPLVNQIVGEGIYDGCVYKPLGADSKTLDGLNVHGAQFDEIHEQTNLNLYNVIADGVTARKQPKILITTTNGFVREGLLDMKYAQAADILNGIYEDDRFLPVIYELDSRDEWQEPEMWVKANPGLDVIKDREKLAEKVERAKKNKRLLPNLLTKDFNITENISSAWLTYDELNNTDTFDIKEMNLSYGIGGADLSSTTDLTAAGILCGRRDDERLYYIPMFWLPEDCLERRIKEDKIPYDIWHEEGLLRLCKGNRINDEDVTAWFIEMREQHGIYTLWAGYDRWGSRNFVRDMETIFGENSIIDIAQGARTLSQPMKELGADLGVKKINYNNNKILKWCLSNLQAKTDVNANIQPVKVDQKAARRIDGAVALLIAYTVFLDKKADYEALL